MILSADNLDQFCTRLLISLQIKVLSAEIQDLQREFESDRSDYLDTIRKQDQQLILLQQILEKVQPTIRKECNYR